MLKFKRRPGPSLTDHYTDYSADECIITDQFILTYSSVLLADTFDYYTQCLIILLPTLAVYFCSSVL